MTALFSRRKRLVIALFLLGSLPGFPWQARAGTTLGEESAPITLEVFSDFECPACAALYLQTLRPLIQNYVATGKVYLIYRDVPSRQHAHARRAACYAIAAAKIGKFEAVAEALYMKQSAWSRDGNVEAVVAAVLTPAELNQVREKLKTSDPDAAIDADLAMARMYGVRGTPTMIVTHKGKSAPVSGTVSYTLLRRYLDQLLSK